MRACVCVCVCVCVRACVCGWLCARNVIITPKRTNRWVGEVWMGTYVSGVYCDVMAMVMRVVEMVTVWMDSELCGWMVT